ncbi:MAG: NTP transferase domain-containing protein [Candidatus Dormibacteria bacterium]
MAGSCAGIVLAAGSSRRMGRPKQLLPLRGRPLLESVVSAACRSRFDDVVVVLGADHALIRRQVRWGRARVVVNPDHASGMSSSLSAGLAALDAGVERAMVILGDQPGVGSELLDRLLEVHSRSGRPAAALRVDGVLQPPVVLDRDLWAEVMALSGDVGARGLIRAHPELVAELVVGQEAEGHVDIDTPDDWRRYCESISESRS